MDIYNKTAEFLVKNNLHNCEICVIIEITGSNPCCDDENRTLMKLWYI